MAILLCLTAGLLPILITPGLLYYFDVSPKILVLLAGAIAALVVFVRKPALPGGRGGKLFAIAIGVQIASLFLSTALSTHAELSVSGTNWRRLGLITQLALLLFMLMAASSATGSLLWLMRTTAATGSAIAVYAILQYFGVDPWIPKSGYHAGEGIFTIVRPPGTLGHANYLATYLVFVVFSGLALARVERGRILRIAGVATAVVSAFALVLTGSRSAMLGLFLGLGFLMLSLETRLRRRAAIAGVAVILLAGVFYVSPAGELLRARVHWIREEPAGGARLLLWRDAAWMASTHWLHGFGPETFGSEFLHYQSLDLARQYPDFYHESPHNIFLDVFAEQGISGLAGLAGITVLGFYLAWKHRSDPLGALLGGAFVGMFVSLQFSAFTLPTAFFFYLSVAGLAGLGALPESLRVRGGYRTLALAGVALFAWFGVHLATADFYLARAHHAIDQREVNEASILMERVRGWQPAGTSSELGYSRHMTNYSSKEPDVLTAALAGRQAFDAAVRACSCPEERQNSYYFLATLFAAQNDLPDTEKSLRGAISAAPNWFKPHWSLARVLALTQHYDEARREAALAMQRGGDRYPAVKETVDELSRRP
jgi:O-antigen ligase